LRSKSGKSSSAEYGTSICAGTTTYHTARGIRRAT
jgi:hypothetical protein